MPRPSNTAARRQQIVDGLMTVMATSGYGGATIPLIAQAAGLTSGLVHYHFDSKQAILLELIQHLTALVDRRFESIKKTSPSSELSAYIDAHLALGSGANPSAVACWIGIGAEAVNQAEVRAAYQQSTELQVAALEKICEKVLKAEGRKANKKRDIALGIFAAIEGCYRLLVAAPDMIPAGFAAPTVKNMAAGLISSQPMAPDTRRK